MLATAMRGDDGSAPGSPAEGNGVTSEPGKRRGREEPYVSPESASIGLGWRALRSA
jgi:hypothetical protein